MVVPVQSYISPKINETLGCESLTNSLTVWIVNAREKRCRRVQYYARNRPLLKLICGLRKEYIKND